MHRSMLTAIITEAWTLSNVSCIYKQKGSKKNKICYRGVSVSSIFGKVAEKVIKDGIVETFLVENDLFF